MTSLAAQISARRLELYVATLGISCWALLAHVWIERSGPILGEHPVLFLIFAGLTLFLEVRPLASLTEDSKLTFSWTFAVTLLLIGPLHSALAVVGITSVVADAMDRRRVDRAVFNSSQFVVSMWLAWLAGSLIAPLNSVTDGGAVTLPWLIAVAVCCITTFLVNTVLIAIVVSFNEGLPVSRMIWRFLGDFPASDGLLLALVPVFILIGTRGLLLLPILLITVGIVVQSASIAVNNRVEATHDQLTGIPNRRMFESHGALIVEQAAISRSVLAVVHIDLDGFKGINDRLGHHYGDAVLQQIADRLSSRKRTADHVARLGGDEFAVILSKVSDAAGAEKAARELLAQIELPLDVEGVPLAVSASLGVALFPDHGVDLKQLVRRADAAMYVAKSKATGVEMARDGDTASGPGRLAILGDLGGAIGTPQLWLAYQPKINMETGKIDMVEALLRWEHPEYGSVPPGWFMPQAEQTDLMNDLTDNVLDMALQQCSIWQNEGIHVGVAVNASARNLHDLRFPNRVAQLLEKNRIDPGWLELEITENTIMEDPVRSASVLGHLRSVGVGLSIDDFGTGYSSLAALRTLTIDRIKIDRSFIQNLAESEADLTIVRAVVELGRNLGLTTVAEGVETNEVLQIVRDLGCDEFQGFLASRPLPGPELSPVLRHGHFELPARANPLPVGTEERLT